MTKFGVCNQYKSWRACLHMSSAINYKLLRDKSNRNKILIIIGLFILLILVFIISISFGAASPGINEALSCIVSRIFPSLEINPGSNGTQTIIMNFRLPRVLLSLIAGAGLAASGAAMQGVLKNPLVSSYVLGVSSAAGFGAALAIVFGIGVVSYFEGYLVMLNAFIFSLLAMVIVYFISRLRGITSETVILTGLAVSYFFSAMSSLIQYLAPESEAVRGVVFWLMGSFNTATWDKLLIIFPIVMISIILMIQQSWNINVLSMGESVAVSLGVNSNQVLAIIMILGSLATAAIISFTGVIGFIGLVSPHLARMMIGCDHRFLIPCSVVLGSVLLGASDTISRLIFVPSEIPVGVVTSLVGVPFFVYMLLSKRRQNWS